MKKSLFIVVDGGEGAGKGTLLDALKAKLGDTAVFTREPGGSPYAEAIRELALKHPLAVHANAATMLCLMFAARFDHLQNTIVPAMERGQHVICDRFDSSTFAYQFFGQQADTSQLRETFATLREALAIRPDFYVYVDVDVQEGLRRVKERGAAKGEVNHFDDRELSFHERLRDGYVEFMKNVPHAIIDANQSRERVLVDFLKEFNRLLKSE